MTEALTEKVDSLYRDLHFIVEKGPATILGEPIILVLRMLITQAKESGADAKICDVLLSASASAAKLIAAEALTITGQLQSIVR
jgi:hypothetical protein